MMAIQGRLAVLPLVHLGGIGAIIGLICGALANTRNRIARWAGILGVLVLFAPLLLLLGVAWYTNTPWASPQPYPGADATRSTSPGAWGAFSNQRYSVLLPIDEIERYYDEQMAKTCEGDWTFGVKSDCPDFDACSICLEAQCEIHRLWMEQRFRVSLCPVSETRTAVSQWDAWED